AELPLLTGAPITRDSAGAGGAGGRGRARGLGPRAGRGARRISGRRGTGSAAVTGSGRRGRSGRRGSAPPAPTRADLEIRDAGAAVAAGERCQRQRQDQRGGREGSEHGASESTTQQRAALGRGGVSWTP